MHAVIAMANRLGFEMHQIDIKGAYLNGKLQENKVLYMQHPLGYKSPDAGTRVLCLVKTLYGLKQSGHRWYQKLSSIFLSLRFKQCAVDQAIYFKVVVTKGKLTIVVVHMDDCTIVANTISLIEELKADVKVQGLKGATCTSCMDRSSVCTSRWPFERTSVNRVLTL